MLVTRYVVGDDDSLGAENDTDSEDVGLLSSFDDGQDAESNHRPP